MNHQSATYRLGRSISKVCWLSVLAFAGMVCSSQVARAEMIVSEQLVTSVQVRTVLEPGGGQLGNLSVWFDIGISEPFPGGSTGASSRQLKSQSGGFDAGGSNAAEKQLGLILLPSMDFCVLPLSLSSGSTSGLSSSGFAGGSGGSFPIAILVSQMRCPAPVLNHFWQGADFIFVPSVFPDELLRPPQI
jgi:hypothetical protein